MVPPRPWILVLVVTLAAALVAALVTTPAKVLRREHQLGQVRSGFFADVVVLDANPLQDPAALRRVRAVIKNGVFARR